MDKNCSVISDLWIQLNPHCRVQGCEVDGAGTVHIWVWYSRSKKNQPLEIVLGNPPRLVINGFKNAINEAARGQRLSKVTGSTVVDDRGLRKDGDKNEI